jgi:hypothetical protein
MTDWLTPDEAAAMLRVTRQRVLAPGWVLMTTR